ncbi:type III secretion protein HrpB7 [Trinickia sp.]|uniref:type III secretion protein HrpB7 n=1 Tax=Trinickia sp. TaxID=2571163 RepID=UPI003F7F061A
MKDRRVATFEVMLGRRRRLDEALRGELAAQREAHAALHEQEAQAKRTLDDEAAQLAEYDRRMTAMLSSHAPLNIPLFTHCGEYRGVVAERHAAARTEWTKARKATEKKESEMIETRRKILRNEGQIEVYERRIAQLMRAAEQAVEDAQDEEVEESMAARALRGRRAEAGTTITKATAPGPMENR